MRVSRVLAGLMALVILAGCGSAAAVLPPKPGPVTKLPANPGSLRMSFALLSSMASQENAVISPVSLVFALAMAAEMNEGGPEAGARLYSYLFSNEDPAQARRQVQDLGDLLSASDPGMVLTLANSAWLKESMTLPDDTRKALEARFSAAIRNIDFDDTASAASTINKWVEEKTRGLIKNLLSPASLAGAEYTLVNALYMKGKWEQAFKKDETKDQAFHGAGGDVQVPMMHQHLKASYYEDGLLQSIWLPYKGGKFGMRVLLPKPGKTVKDVMAAMTPETWSQWTGRTSPSEGDLSLPRFKVEFTSRDIYSALRQMGMPAIRDGLTQVLQKTYVKVDEEGTEAAAATAVTVATAYAPSEKPFNMVVDRPFVFAITAVGSDTPLFLGSVSKP
ncbi:MAG TPA: serpin family protein [Candidatus Anoxymicrobiaceae bacterium]